MKKILYLTLFALPAMSGTAIASELSIGMADNAKFVLAFDNAFYSTPSNTYNVTNVQPGMHHVRMTSAPAQMTGACGFPRLLFDGWVNVPANARVTAYAISLNQLNITSVTSLAPYGTGYYDPYNPYGAGYGSGYNYPDYSYGNNGYGNGYGNNGYGSGGNGYGGWSTPPVYYGMSAADFEALKNSVRAQSFDSNRLAVAKQAVSANHLTAQQVLELLKEFSFESSKLEIAKFAYGRTIDRNNYYLVNNGFAFSSSVDELSEYINSWHA